MTRPQAMPICSACREPMNGRVMEFKDGGVVVNRYYCLACDETWLGEPAPVPEIAAQDEATA